MEKRLGKKCVCRFVWALRRDLQQYSMPIYNPCFPQYSCTGMDWASGIQGNACGQIQLLWANLFKKVYYKSFLSTATAHWLIFLKDIGLIQ